MIRNTLSILVFVIVIVLFIAIFSFGKKTFENADLPPLREAYMVCLKEQQKINEELFHARMEKNACEIELERRKGTDTKTPSP